MRLSILRRVALLAVCLGGAGAVSGSGALGQQFTILANNIWDGSGFAASYNGPTTGFDGAGLVSDGGFDAFDLWMYPTTGLGSLSLHRRVDALSAINTYRHIDTYTNNTAGPLTVPLNMAGELGSDGFEVIVRNDAYAWISHDSVIQQNTGDAAVSLMNGNNAWTLANIIRTNLIDDIELTYTLTLQPGQSITLMWATFLARDLSDRSGDVSLSQNTVNAMLANPLASGLYTGLTNAEIASIVNWTIPTPGAAALLGLGGLMTARRRRA